jgi:uncharacterized protein YyaL (SSP411 family)
LQEQTTVVPPLEIEAGAAEQAARRMAAVFDPRYGGFGAAPKFPQPSSLSLLLRHHAKTGDGQSLSMARTTLDGMKNGGIYDHLGGGFARYSTDEKWLVPHFEKMLYDNAQLARVYLEAFQACGDREYRRVATETLDYVLREMQDPAGGFYSATDADSEGEEGRFFVFSRAEIEEILGGEDADRFCKYYDVSGEGNWHGTNILNTPRKLDEVAQELGVSGDRFRAGLDLWRERVYRARAERVPPNLDDKILVSWNALMIGALGEGYRVLSDRRYLRGAERAADFVLEKMRRPDGGLYRTARNGRAHLDAYLEDYAHLADALIDLYEAGAAARFLGLAAEIAERMVADYGDPEGGAFFHTAHGHEKLLVRVREGHDGAMPSANAVAARALARLSVHLDRPDFREAAEGAIRHYGRYIEKAPDGFATAVAVAGFLTGGPVELALVGEPGEQGYEALRRAVAEHHLPDRVVAHFDPARGDGGGNGNGAPEQPLLKGKTLVNGKAALYVCRAYTCAAPLTDPRAVRGALSG